MYVLAVGDGITYQDSYWSAAAILTVPGTVGPQEPSDPVSAIPDYSGQSVKVALFGNSYYGLSHVASLMELLAAEISDAFAQTLYGSFNYGMQFNTNNGVLQSDWLGYDYNNIQSFHDAKGDNDAQKKQYLDLICQRAYEVNQASRSLENYN